VDHLSHQTQTPGGARGILHGVPVMDIMDETFLAVPPKTIAVALADPVAWRRFWPDLDLAVYLDRGDQGLRWTVAGALVGTMEVWLEPMLDGTVLHYFLRADPPAGRKAGEKAGAKALARRWRRKAQRRRFDAKQVAFVLKRSLEDGRAAGVAPTIIA
jgi:hypothetical protein